MLSAPRSASSSTHTVPPYPPIARRMGAEGKVTLRLTVSAEGRVTQAEIVTSSGREELDQAAQAWIVAHWTYRPARTTGPPVASQVLATVTFSLADAALKRALRPGPARGRFRRAVAGLVRLLLAPRGAPRL